MTRSITVSPTNLTSKILGPDGKPLSLAYEASSSSARLGNWGGQDISPTGADSEQSILKRRARDMVRNMPFSARAIAADVANEIGTGIKVKPATPDKDFNKDLKALYKDWMPQADAADILSLFGIQAQAVRARRESGEVFIRSRARRPQDGLVVPLQFQVIESDFCPTTLNQTRKNGNQIKSGIEFNAIGKRVAYWFYRQHPSDGGNLSDMVRVPAEQVIHHFIPLRPGQIRGMPVGVQAFIKAFVYDKYDNAELVRKESRAQFTGVITQEPFGDDFDESEYNFDPITGQPLDGQVGAFNIEPGTFKSLERGEDFKLFEGDNGGAHEMDFARRQLLAIAAAYGVPYEILTGDYSKINDRVWRAIMNQYRRELEQTIEHYTIQQICRAMHAMFVDAVVLNGCCKIPFDYAAQPHAYKRATYHPHAWPYIHPVQDIQALKLAEEMGLDSMPAIQESRNKDPDQVAKERKEHKERLADYGLLVE